jgi:hypothetical protein
MAILNFTRISSAFGLSAFFKNIFSGHQHEKKSCSLNNMSDSDLLLLNGKHVEISYISKLHSFSLTAKGRVLAVLVPAVSGSINRAILFLADGEYDPEFFESDIVFLIVTA